MRISVSRQGMHPCPEEQQFYLYPLVTNSVSELYDAHPDWIIKAPKRDAVQGRGGTQLILDMGNPKVQDFVFSVVPFQKRTGIGMWRSWLAHYVRDVGVVRSSRIIPTEEKQANACFS